MDSLINVQCLQVHCIVFVSCDGVGNDVIDSPPSSATENSNGIGGLAHSEEVNMRYRLWYGMCGIW